MIGRAPAIVGVAAWLMTGCLNVPEGSQDASIRDSASVRIVENRVPVWGAESRWSVSETPRLSVGTVQGDEEYAFAQLSDVALLPDGRIVAADRGSSTLRFFSLSGQYIGEVGGDGGGPGEYADLQGITWLSDETLVVDDGISQRLSVLDEDGEFERSFSLDLAPGFYNVGFYNVVGVTRTGRFLVYSGSGRGFGESDVGQLINDTLRFFWFDHNGAFGGLVASLPGRPRWGFRSARGVSFPYVPLSAGPIAAVTAQGFLVGPGMDAEFTVYDSRGAPMRIVRWASESRTITDELRDRWRTRGVGARASRQDRVESARLIAEAELGEDLPVAMSVLVDEMEHVWVERYRLPWEATPVWEVFNPSGRWLGSVNTPRAFRVREIGSDYVLGIWRDELEVEHIRVFDLTRGEGHE